MSTLKVNTVESASTPTVLISDGLSVSGVSTLTGGLKVGSAVTISDNGNFGITGIMTASSFVGSGANLTGISTTGYTATSSTTLNSTSFDYTNFPSDIRMFDVIFRSVQTASVDWGIRIGDSGGIETATYVVRSGYNRSGDLAAESNTGGFFTHGLASSYTTSGFFRFISLTNAQNRWQCFARLTENGTADHVFTIDGYRHLDGALTSIRILPESGSFSAGEVHLITYHN